MRRTLAILAVLGSTLALAACTGASTDASTPTPTPLSCATSGDASDAVTTTGDFGTKPVTIFPAPLETDTTEVTVASAGSGETVAEDDMVLLDYTL